MGSRFCKNCGAEIPNEPSGNCPKCGAVPLTSDTNKPVKAAVLSLFIPGLGQSYNGNALKGIGLFLGVVILWILSVVMFSDALFILTFVLWIIGVFDAYRDAGRMNRGEIPGKKHQMWLFGGVAVVAVVILAVIFAIVFVFFVLSAFPGYMHIFDPVVCVPGKGCMSPLQGEAVCNTTSQCIASAQTRIDVRYYPDAIKFLDRALALDPQNAQALTLMGVARAKSGNLTGAIIPLDMAVAVDPSLSAAWENRGIVQAMSGKNTASRINLEKAVTLPGNSSLTWYNLGVERSREGNASEAVDAYNHALLIDNNCISCQQMRGKSLIALGQYDAALGIFDNITTPGLIRIESRQEKGNALAGLKKYEESCVAFDAAIDAYPSYAADIWSRVCNQTTNRCEPLRATAEPLTERDRETKTGALAFYDNQLKTSPDDSNLWISQGEILINLMRYDEAVASFEHSITLKPENAPAQNGKGVALFYAGNNTLSLAAFNLALKADPGFIKSWNNGAFVLMKQERYEIAAKAYQNALYYARQQTDPKGTADFIFETVF